MTVRTQDEIVARIDFIDGDMFGAEEGDLINFLDFEHAKPFLKEDVTEEQWSKSKAGISPRGEIISYLPFAWDKANNCRGISASRSLSHFRAWVWLIDKDLYDMFEMLEYEYYGKPHLVIVSEFVGFDWKKEDSDLWGNDEDDQRPRSEFV